MTGQDGREADPGLRTRFAGQHEINSVNQLCRVSKASWGYDSTFLDRVADELEVPVSAVDARLVLVAEDDSGLVGVGALEPCGEQMFEVSHLFVHPDAMGRGAGALLYARLVERASVLGAEKLRIVSDPNAVKFYEKMGAKLVGSERSSLIAGRTLPVLQVSL